MQLYNTLTKSIQQVQPSYGKTIKLYACGPTVYDYSHIGHIRKYLLDDVLVRTLRKYFTVQHVMNITDVGHLVSDGDVGEDKLEKGARKHKKTVWDVATFYTDYFSETMHRMGIQKPDIICKATEHIDSMISLIQSIVEKKMAYETAEAVYFDVNKYGNYGVLNGQKIGEKKIAVRAEVAEDPHKKHPADFALWFKRQGRFANHTMHWHSPWGDGFPGWHIECSAMSMQYLGPHIDIHTGGIDHIPVHHENEIAQSETATGQKPFVACWVHHNHLFIEGEKMSKSLGNFMRLEDIYARGYTTNDIRYLMFQTHYRKQMNFTWESLAAAAKGRIKLEKRARTVSIMPDMYASLWSILAEDLNTSKFLAQTTIQAKESHTVVTGAMTLWEQLVADGIFI